MFGWALAHPWQSSCQLLTFPYCSLQLFALSWVGIQTCKSSWYPVIAQFYLKSFQLFYCDSNYCFLTQFHRPKLFGTTHIELKVKTLLCLPQWPIAGGTLSGRPFFRRYCVLQHSPRAPSRSKPNGYYVNSSLVSLRVTLSHKPGDM